MATVYRDRGRWRCQIQIKGFERSKSFKHKKAAELWGIETEASIEKFANAEAASMTLRALVERYLKEITPTHKGIESETARLGAFLRLPICDRALQSLSHKDFEAYRDERLATRARGRKSNVMPATVQKELYLWSSIFRVAVTDWRLMTVNPIDGVRIPDSSPARKAMPSDDDMSDFLEWFDLREGEAPTRTRQWVGLMFLIATETGMRRGELLKLRIRDVVLRRKYVTALDTKNGDDRDVPLSPRAIELVTLAFNSAPRPDGIESRLFPVTVHMVKNHWQRGRKKLQAHHLRFHDTRRRAGTNLAKRLKPMPLMRTLGHRDMRSTMIYYAPSVTDIADDLDPALDRPQSGSSA